MKTRIYAEAMYGSVLWQIVRQDAETGELSIIQRDLQKEDARQLAEAQQKAADEDSDKINSIRK